MRASDTERGNDSRIVISNNAKESEMLKPRSEVRQRVDEFYQCQRNRIAAENRLRAFEQGKDESVAEPAACDQIIELMILAEKVAIRRIEAALEGHPVMEWAMGIPGLNRATIGRIVGLIDDPTQFARFSNLRSFAGLCHLNNKRKKGEQMTFSMRMKTALFIAFDCMLKQENAKLKFPPAMRYTAIYRNWREIYRTRYGVGNCKNKDGNIDADGNTYTADDEVARDWPDLRQHYAAKNKMMDVFLYHLWEEWLDKLGHEAPGLYVHEVLGHHMKYCRFDFTHEQASKAKRRRLSTSKSLDADIGEMRLEIVGPSGKVEAVV